MRLLRVPTHHTVVRAAAGSSSLFSVRGHHHAHQGHHRRRIMQRRCCCTYHFVLWYYNYIHTSIQYGTLVNGKICDLHGRRGHLSIYVDVDVSKPPNHCAEGTGVQTGRRRHIRLRSLSPTSQNGQPTTPRLSAKSCPFSPPTAPVHHGSKQRRQHQRRSKRSAARSG